MLELLPVKKAEPGTKKFINQFSGCAAQLAAQHTRFLLSLSAAVLCKLAHREKTHATKYFDSRHSKFVN